MNRASQREMPRTGKSKPLIHALQLVNSKPKMLLMIRNGDRPSQRGFTRGLDSNPRPEPRGAAADPGRPTVKNHIPSSTNSFHHPHAIQPRQTCTYKSRKRQVCTTGLPCGSIPLQGGWFRAGSCKAQENLPIPFLLPEENTPDIEQIPMEL